MTWMVEASTLEHIKMSPDPAKEFEDLFDDKGEPVELDEVHVSCWPKACELKGKLKPGYGGGSDWSRFGPEYAFGIHMHKKLQQPILIIKCAQGGRDLFFNFRPPSAGEWTPPPGHPDAVAGDASNPERVKTPAEPKKAVPESSKTIKSFYPLILMPHADMS